MLKLSAVSTALVILATVGNVVCSSGDSNLAEKRVHVRKDGDDHIMECESSLLDLIGRKHLCVLVEGNEVALLVF